MPFLLVTLLAAFSLSCFSHSIAQQEDQAGLLDHQFRQNTVDDIDIPFANPLDQSSSPPPPPPPPSSSPFSSFSSIGCAQFVACERQLMLVHRRCTEKSRRAIAGRCGLGEEFKELVKLGEQRVARFGECLLGEEAKETAKVDERKCRGEFDNMSANGGGGHPGGCWLELAKLRKQCQLAQHCCGSAPRCIPWLAQSASSIALRRQHQLINRKTLQCRANSANPNLKNVPSAALSLKKLHSDEKKPKKKDGGGGINLSTRLAYFEQLIRVLEQRMGPKTVPSWMVRLAARAGRPSQFMADHQPKGIFRASRRIQQERKAAAAVQQLIGRTLPQAFALPSMDLRRMRLLAARPHLARTFGAIEQRRMNLMWGMRRESEDAFGRELGDDRKGGQRAFGVKTAAEGGRAKEGVAAEKSTQNGQQTWSEREERMDERDKGNGQKKALSMATPSPSSSPSSTTIQSTTITTFAPSTPSGLRLPAHPFIPSSRRIFPQIWVRPRSNWPSTTTSRPDEMVQQIPPAESGTTAKWGETIEQSEWNEKAARNGQEGKGATKRSGKITRTITTNIGIGSLYGEGEGKEERMKRRKEEKRRKGGMMKEDGKEEQEGGGGGPNADAAERTQMQRHSGQAKPAVMTKRPKTRVAQGGRRVEITLKGSRQKVANIQKGYRAKVLAAKIHAGVAKIHQNVPKPGAVPREIRRSPPKLVAANFSLPVQLKTGWAELEQLRRALVRQLDKFMGAPKGRRAPMVGAAELASPLALLNCSKQESDRLGLGLDHCRLFSACQSQLRLLQSGPCPSPSQGQRLVPGPPRRRFGRCNSRLLPLFQRTDAARAELEKEAEKCLADAMAKGKEGRKQVECPHDWPLMPSLPPQLECPERISLLQQHCRKLGKCCANWESCQRQIDESALAREIRLEGQRVARRSAKCQLHAQQMFRMIRERKKTAEKGGG